MLPNVAIQKSSLVPLIRKVRASNLDHETEYIGRIFCSSHQFLQGNVEAELSVTPVSLAHDPPKSSFTII